MLFSLATVHVIEFRGGVRDTTARKGLAVGSLRPVDSTGLASTGNGADRTTAPPIEQRFHSTYTQSTVKTKKQFNGNMNNTTQTDRERGGGLKLRMVAQTASRKHIGPHWLRGHHDEHRVAAADAGTFDASICGSGEHG